MPATFRKAYPSSEAVIKSLPSAIYLYAAGTFAVAWYFGVGFLTCIYLLPKKLLGFAHTVERFVVVLGHAEMYAVDRAVSIARPDPQK